MTEVLIVCGDSDGGPHAEVRLEFPGREPEDFTGEEVADLRRGISELFRASHDRDPDSTIVAFA